MKQFPSYTYSLLFFLFILSPTLPSFGQCTPPNNLRMNTLKLDTESNTFSTLLIWDAVTDANFYTVTVSTNLETFLPEQFDVPQANLNFDGFDLTVTERITLQIQADCGTETSQTASITLDLSATPIDFNCLPPTNVTAIIEENTLTVKWMDAPNAETTELILKTTEGLSIPLSFEAKGAAGEESKFQMLLEAPTLGLDSIAIFSTCPDKATQTGPIVIDPIGTIGNVEGIPPADICASYCNETYEEYSVLTSNPIDTVYAMCDYCATFCENDFCVNSILSLPKEVATFYPNPFDLYLQLDFVLLPNSPIEVSFYDIGGKLIEKQTLYGSISPYTIYTDHWSKGLYLCKIQNRGSVFYEKVLKK